MTLEMILKSGKIENEEQAKIFADNAEFYDYEDEGWGDFRIKTESGFAEIYGHREKSGEDEEMPVADSNQEIRFYDKEMKQEQKKGNHKKLPSKKTSVRDKLKQNQGIIKEKQQEQEKHDEIEKSQKPRDRER